MPEHPLLSSLSASIPRILIASRRSVRKNKYIDFVGEYHLDLIVHFNGCPVIIPRVDSISNFLSSFPPFHGLLLTEGEDIGPDSRPNEPPPTQATKDAHPSDSSTDPEKDKLEFALVAHCLANDIPILAICRGSQLVNIAAGGTLLSDVATVLGSAVCHMDYQNYDTHRHPLSVVEDTPLFHWFDNVSELNVNSYHHQGISVLADRFVPMAYAPDGLIEAYCDPTYFDPEQGKFIIGIQFHPERMQNTESALKGHKFSFDYPGCARPYEDFVRAATIYLHKSLTISHSPMTNANVSPRGAELCDHIFEHVPLTPLDPLQPLVSPLPLCSGNEERNDHVFSERVRLNRNMFSKTSSRRSTYSKEDIDSLMRSGASVHGTRRVYNLLHGMGGGNDENEDNNDLVNVSPKPNAMSNWRRFEKGLLQAERGLRGLQGSAKIKDAIALVQKLSKELAISEVAMQSPKTCTLTQMKDCS